MIDYLKKSYKKAMKVQNLNALTSSSSEERLEFMRASYKKFRPDMSQTERDRMKKSIKKFERKLKRGEV